MRTLSLLLFLYATASQAQVVLLDRVVALVDGKPVLRSAVDQRFKELLSQVKDAEAFVKLGPTMARDQVVDELLIAHDADALHVEVEPADVDKALEMVAESNKLTREQLEAEVVKQGLTVPRYRAMLRAQLLEMKWMRAKLARMPDAEEADAVKKKLIAELRERAVIEVRP